MYKVGHKEDYLDIIEDLEDTVEVNQEHIAILEDQIYKLQEVLPDLKDKLFNLWRESPNGKIKDTLYEMWSDIGDMLWER